MTLLQSIFLFISIQAVPPEAIMQNKDFLVRQLQNASSDLRINAVQKLGELRYPDTLSSLGDLAKDPVPEVRFAAIQGIAKFSNQEALDVLNSKFSNEADPYLKSEIRRSIKSIEDFLKPKEPKAKSAKPSR